MTAQERQPNDNEDRQRRLANKLDNLAKNPTSDPDAWHTAGEIIGATEEIAAQTANQVVDKKTKDHLNVIVRLARTVGLARRSVEKDKLDTARFASQAKSSSIKAQTHEENSGTNTRRAEDEANRSADAAKTAQQVQIEIENARQATEEATASALEEAEGRFAQMVPVPGPEGPAGPQGETGDVTPEARELAEKAKTSETNAAGSATTAAGAADEAKKAKGEALDAIETDKEERKTEIDKVRALRRWMIGGIIGAIAIAAGGYFFPRSCATEPQIPATPTPGAATGTPRPPTEMPKPTATLVSTPIETACPTPTPRPPEVVVRTPEFGIKLDSAGNYQVIDKKTGKVIDTSKYSYPRLSYKETGVGNTKDISVSLQPGQTAVIQGYVVNGTVNGVFETLTAYASPVKATFRITDGAVSVVNTVNAPVELTKAIQIAISNGWAHGTIVIPEPWKAN